MDLVYFGNMVFDIELLIWSTKSISANNGNKLSGGPSLENGFDINKSITQMSFVSSVYYHFIVKEYI